MWRREQINSDQGIIVEYVAMISIPAGGHGWLKTCRSFSSLHNKAQQNYSKEQLRDILPEKPGDTAQYHFLILLLISTVFFSGLLCCPGLLSIYTC
jgi:hypothetical protein